MADYRRIVLIDTNGATVGMIDVSHVHHANTQAAVVLEVQTRCDLGEWHLDSRWPVPCWGPAVSEASHER